MEWNSKNIKAAAGLISGMILFAWLLKNLAGLLAFLGTLLGIAAPFLIGLCIAFILNVPMRAAESELFPEKLRKKHPGLYRMRRPASLLFTLLLLGAVIFLVLFIVVPEVGRTFGTLRAGLPAFAARFHLWWSALSARLPVMDEWIPGAQPQWSNLIDAVVSFLKNGASSALQSTVGVATSVFSGILNFFIGFVFAIYVLLRKDILARQCRKVLYAYLPERMADEFLRISRLANKTFSRFISGQCLEAVILGALFFVAMSIFRFPYAMMISVLITFTALIPVFGAFIGCAVGVLMILVGDPAKALWFVLLFLVIQQLENNLIYPRVVGNSVGLPAMWVMLAVLVGGSTMGVLGMLVMVPLCSVLYALLRESVNHRLQKRQTPPRKLE